MKLKKIFPACFTVLDEETEKKLRQQADGVLPEHFPQMLLDKGSGLAIPPYLADLARLEYAVFLVREKGDDGSADGVDKLIVSPSLQLLRLDWKNLALQLPERGGKSIVQPLPGEEFVLVYLGPVSGKVLVRPARENDLLALKIVAEGISPFEAAKAAGVAVGVIDRCLEKAELQGILLAPPSLIRRDPSTFFPGRNIDESFLVSPVFTLQWHVTQTCDLHCRHCYDRSDRIALPLEQGLRILDDLRNFCVEHHVKGQVSFSGGNPLLYPHFFELYQGAIERNMMAAILGNPAPRSTLEKILAIAEPVFYQVSLEGLQEHNDYIRGPGHFERVLGFLGLLKELGIYSMVMLTLTRANMEQVLPLAELLRDRVDLFTFNRLAMVGEGAQLQSADRNEFQEFLRRYLAAARRNPVISLKDNLLNIVRREENMQVFGGCAGHGCGAAFNFISILPDGEAHACRKFPSHIGNVFQNSISEIYHGEQAARYRSGAAECAPCAIRPVCGGCLAVVHGLGLNPFQDRDPYCFI
ncbi:MAG: thio(seleno)oxazole modification radical SAM maturase SbtM [Pseudomonadota bacterium]